MSSSMVFCRGCGKEIHSSARTCPHCGAPQGQISEPGSPAGGGTGAEKNKVMAGVLALLLGGVGIHKFYTGAWGWGIVYIVLVWTWIPSIVALAEGIRYLTLTDEDFQKKVAALDGPFGILW